MKEEIFYALDHFDNGNIAGTLKQSLLSASTAEKLSKNLERDDFVRNIAAKLR